MKKLLTLGLLALSLVSARATTVIVTTGSPAVPIKLMTTSGQAGTAVSSGIVRVGVITNANVTEAMLSGDAKLSDVASRLFFLGAGGNTGTSTISLSNGAISGSIAGFLPSGQEYASKQMYVLIAQTADLATATDATPWALVKVPDTTSALWNTGAANSGTKTLSMVTVGASGVALHGKFENDNVVNAVTGIVLTPSSVVPEPSIALLVGLTGLAGFRRRRA